MTLWRAWFCLPGGWPSAQQQGHVRETTGSWGWRWHKWSSGLRILEAGFYAVNRYDPFNGPLSIQGGLSLEWDVPKGLCEE